MPIYEYLCDSCGPFEKLRSIDDFAEPAGCPDCGADAPRVILTAPRLALMPGHERRAHAINERSAHAPHFSTKDSRAAGHGPGCSCCGGSNPKKKSRAVHGPDGSRGFPAARPWMISH